MTCNLRYPMSLRYPVVNWLLRISRKMHPCSQGRGLQCVLQPNFAANGVGVLQCVAVYVAMCVAVCVAAGFQTQHLVWRPPKVSSMVMVCCSVLQYVAVCCSVLQCVLQCVLQPNFRSNTLCRDLPKVSSMVKVCCSVLQCVAVCVAGNLIASWHFRIFRGRPLDVWESSHRNSQKATRS